jgi:hypothetical protein
MSTHGGSRPGAGRPPGTPNPNAGRPQTVKRLRVGQKVLAQRITADGRNVPSEVWKIVSVSRAGIEIKTGDGDTIHVIT